jgi:hypothetical protein
MRREKERMRFECEKHFLKDFFFKEIGQNRTGREREREILQYQNDDRKR